MRVKVTKRSKLKLSPDFREMWLTDCDSYLDPGHDDLDDRLDTGNDWLPPWTGSPQYTSWKEMPKIIEENSDLSN